MITAPKPIISHISINGSEINIERLTFIIKHNGMMSNKEIAVATNIRFFKNRKIKYTNHKKTTAIKDIRIPIGTSKVLPSIIAFRTRINGIMNTLREIKEYIIPFLPNLITGIDINHTNMLVLIGYKDQVKPVRYCHITN